VTEFYSNLDPFLLLDDVSLSHAATAAAAAAAAASAALASATAASAAVTAAAAAAAAISLILIPASENRGQASAFALHNSAPRALAQKAACIFIVT